MVLTMRVKLRGQNHSVYAVANGNVLLFKLYGGSVSQLGACRCDDESKTKGHHDQKKTTTEKRSNEKDTFGSATFVWQRDIQ